MIKLIEDNKNKLIKLCKKFKVKSLYLFGSATKNNFTTNSDLDFLISFQDNISIEEYGENYFDLHYKLQELFKRNIDLVTERTISNPYFIENINQSRVLIYEA